MSDITPEERLLNAIFGRPQRYDTEEWDGEIIEMRFSEEVIEQFGELVKLIAERYGQPKGSSNARPIRNKISVLWFINGKNHGLSLSELDAYNYELRGWAYGSQVPSVRFTIRKEMPINRLRTYLDLTATITGLL